MSELPADLPEETRALYARYLKQPLASREAMADQVNEYLKTLQEEADASEVVDVTMAKNIGAGLLDLIKNAHEEGLAHVQAATIYFIRSEDVTPDMETIAGFDDDAQVFNAVCAHLGRRELEVV